MPIDNGCVPTISTGSGTNFNEYQQMILPGFEYYGGVIPDDIYEAQSDQELEVIEESVVEREYDDQGRVTKETRRVLRPKQRKLPNRTPPITPREYQPLVPSPVPNLYPSYPASPQIWCGVVNN